MKILKGLGIFILSLVLLVLINTICVINTTKDYVDRDYIKKELRNTNVLLFLTGNDGKELKEITELKQELVKAGFPESTIDDVINSNVIVSTTTDLVFSGIDFILTGDEQEVLDSVTKENIIKYASDNINLVVDELQKNNVPGSEKITEEVKKDIIKEIEKEANKYEEKLNEVKDKVYSELENSEEFKEFKNNRKLINEILDGTKDVFSTKTIIILSIISIIVIAIMSLLTKYKYSVLKHIGIINLLSSTIYFIGYIMFDEISTRISADKRYDEVFRSLVDKFKNSFCDCTTWLISLGLLMIISNIVLYFVFRNKHRED